MITSQMLEHTPRKPLEPSVSRIQTPAAEVYIDHSQFLENPPKLWISDAHGGPKSQGFNVKPGQNFLCGADFPKQVFAAFEHTKVVMAVGMVPQQMALFKYFFDELDML